MSQDPNTTMDLPSQPPLQDGIAASHAASECVQQAGPSAQIADADDTEPVASLPAADAEDLKDGLVLAEDLKDALGALRDRAKGLRRFFQRLVDSERAAVKVLHKSVSKDGRRAPSLGVAVRNQDKMEHKGKMAQLPSRLRALWEQRALQMESLAGVWDSQSQRWSSHGAALHEARRRVEEDTRPLAKELCAARADADRLQRKYLACRSAAVQALRSRGSIEGNTRFSTSGFATACGVGKSDKEFQKAVKRSESAFRDYVLTKQELNRQAEVLQQAEEQHRAQIVKLLALAKDEHNSFFRELKESLQLTISSFNVFCGTMLDVHSELGDHGALLGGDVSDDAPDSPVGSDHGQSSSPGTGRSSLFRSYSPSSPGTWKPPKILRLSTSSVKRESFVEGADDGEVSPTAVGNSAVAKTNSTANAGSGSEKRGAKLETEEMAQTLCQNLDADRNSLKALQGLLLGFRDAEDQALRNLTVAQLPAASQVEPKWIEEASTSLKNFVNLRIEAAGCMTTLLAEQLLPAVDGFLSEVKNDILLVQEEQRRMETSLSQKTQKQKLMEVPIHFDNEDSERIYQERLVRIADEVKERIKQRFSASGAMLDELLAAERSRLHIQICDAAPQALGRLAAKSSTTDSRLPLWWSHNVSMSSTANLATNANAQSDDDQLLEAESTRVKAVARAVSDFTGKDGFSFRSNDQVKIIMQVGDMWQGIDPQGTQGEFPSHLVEVGDVSALQKMSLADLVSLFKRDVLENEAYVPSAEDEEFASRFSEYLGEASGPAIRVLASFSCALLSRRKVPIAALQKVLETKQNLPANLLDTVPLQGRLYVTAKWMGFFSHFSTTSFQDSTSLLFRISEMASLEKRTNAFILQNCIEVSLSDGSTHTFASFEHRDSAYEYLVNLRLVSRSVQSEQESLLGGGDGEAAAEGSSADAGEASKFQLVVLPASSSAPYPSLDPGVQGPSSPLKHELPGRIFGVPVEILFDVVFREFGQDTLQAEYQVANGSKLASGQTESPPWIPAPPMGACCVPVAADVSADGGGPPKRQVRWLRPVTAGAGWMRRMAKMPEWLECDEAWGLYGLGEGKGFVVTLDAELAGMPYIDYFTLKVRYKAVAVGASRVQLDAEVELDWRKSTLLQSRIEQTSVEEVRNTFESNLLPLISKKLADSPLLQAQIKSQPGTPGATSNSVTGSNTVAEAAAALQKRAKNAVGSRGPTSSGGAGGGSALLHQVGSTLLNLLWSFLAAIPKLLSNAQGWPAQVWCLIVLCSLLLAILASLFRIERLLAALAEKQLTEVASGALKCTSD